MTAWELVQTDSAMHHILSATLDKSLIIVFGLPGMGKSLVSNALVGMHLEQKKKVKLLLWDMSGAKFKQIAAAFSSHELMIRHAAGLWARKQAEQANDIYPSETVVIMESPLVDNRFVEFVRSYQDNATQVLQDHTKTIGLIVAPTKDVREAVLERRAQRFADPIHESEKEDCPVDLAQEYWHTLHAVAVKRGLTQPASTNPIPFDPTVYNALYKELCGSVPTTSLPVSTFFDTTTFSPYHLPNSELLEIITPTETEVQHFLAVAEKNFANTEHVAHRHWTQP